MNQQDHIVDALYIVSAWNIPDEQLTQAVKDRANLMAGISPDELREEPQDIR